MRMRMPCLSEICAEYISRYSRHISASANISAWPTLVKMFPFLLIVLSWFQLQGFGLRGISGDGEGSTCSLWQEFRRDCAPALGDREPNPRKVTLAGGKVVQWPKGSSLRFLFGSYKCRYMDDHQRYE